jgi:hypothetical protein
MSRAKSAAPSRSVPFLVDLFQMRRFQVRFRRLVDVVDQITIALIVLAQEAASGLLSSMMRVSFFAALPSRTASLNFCGGIETWTMKSSSSSFLLYRSTVHGRTSKHQIERRN